MRNPNLETNMSDISTPEFSFLYDVKNKEYNKEKKVESTLNDEDKLALVQEQKKRDDFMIGLQQYAQQVQQVQQRPTQQQQPQNQGNVPQTSLEGFNPSQFKEMERLSQDLPKMEFEDGGTKQNLQGMKPYEVYESVTGESWSTAKSKGLTDGSYEKNLELKSNLISRANSKKSNVNEVIPSEVVDKIEKEESQLDPRVLDRIRQSVGRDKLFKDKGRVYGTSTKGETLEVDDKTIEMAGLPVKETRRRLTIENELVKSPYTSKNTVKVEPSFRKWDEIKSEQLEINKMAQDSVINHYHKMNNIQGSYVVVDKKKGLMHIYDSPNNTPQTFPVDLGAREWDAQSVTKFKDTNKNNKTDQEEVKNSNVDWTKSNHSTGAGKFYISNIDEKGYSGLPILNKMNERQYENIKEKGEIENVATSLHKGYVADDDFRVSNGCIRCNKGGLKSLVKNINMETPVYILPEDHGNAFVLENGKLNFKVKSGQNYNTYVPLEDYKNHPTGEERVKIAIEKMASGTSKFDPSLFKAKQGVNLDESLDRIAGGASRFDSKTYGLERGQGINRGQNALNHIPIKLEVSEQKFKQKAEELGFSGGYDPDQYNYVVKPFIKSLEKNKAEIMSAAKINGDAYNDIAKVAFGILGTETNFGDKHGALTNLAKAANKFINSDNS